MEKQEKSFSATEKSSDDNASDEKISTEKTSYGKKVHDSLNMEKGLNVTLLYLITYTVEIDIVISIILQTCTDISQACPTSVTALTWILFSRLIIAYIIVVIWSLLSLYVRQTREKKQFIQLKHVIFITFLTVCKLITLVCFLLADNNLPLASAFANAEKSAVLRLTLLSVSFVIKVASYPIFALLFTLLEM